MSTTPESTPSSEPIDLKKLESVIKDARKLATAYRVATGRVLGVVAEICEFDAAQKLGLTLPQVSPSGYSASKTLKGESVFFLIKGKQVSVEKPTDVAGKFNLRGSWTTAVLVLLDDTFSPTAIFLAPKKKIQDYLKISEARGNPPSVVTIGAFKTMAGAPMWKK